MKRFSNSFWLVEVPIIAAYIHLVGCCASIGFFPSIRLNGFADDLLETTLFWPGTLICWVFSKNAVTGGVGLLLSFLWAPGLAFWGTRTILKWKEAK